MKNLEKVEKEALEKIEKAQDRNELESIRIHYFGRKSGILTILAGELPKLPNQEKRKVGPVFNKVKNSLQKALAEKSGNFQEAKSTNTQEPKNLEMGEDLPFDPTIPGRSQNIASSHPLTSVVDEVKEIFHYLGFSWVDGPEVELDLYNFQKLLIPKDHPSRDVQQTYYINDELLLRTHTSPMQVRYMETHQPPIRIISPGRAYRRDMPDATHLPDFLQIEGLLVDTETSMTDLMGSLDFFAKRMFGESSRVRFYGHNFPYTEPSIEIEVFHEKQGWIEILGAGMVHPEVLRGSGVDPEKYRGWAFGMGPNRLAMLKYGIDDIRALYSSDLRFLKQF
ncbi:MAG: phenylalanine--tRNA ligase subunit alpha [Candidatus Woykebacteria bacterium]